MEIGVFEAKARLSELAERASRGEVVHITKRGKRLARLVAEEGALDSITDSNPWQAWLNLRQDIPLRMGRQEILDTISEGRR